jgi:hypothetical protein
MRRSGCRRGSVSPLTPGPPPLGDVGPRSSRTPTRRECHLGLASVSARAHDESAAAPLRPTSPWKRRRRLIWPLSQSPTKEGGGGGGGGGGCGGGGDGGGDVGGGAGGGGTGEARVAIPVAIPVAIRGRTNPPREVKGLFFGSYSPGRRTFLPGFPVKVRE